MEGGRANDLCETSGKEKGSREGGVEKWKVRDDELLCCVGDHAG